MKPIRVLVVVAGGLLLSACGGSRDALRDLEPGTLNEIMLEFADPSQAVNYFGAALARDPDDAAAKRSLASALARAGRYEEAVGFFAELSEGSSTGERERLTYADALLRTGNWQAAEAQVARVPASARSYERSRLLAVLADIRKDWGAADANYADARRLTVRPAPILNNWGVSKLSRGAFGEAEGKFREAISFDRELFAAKNNLVIARGRQRNYALPIIPMTELERAQLLHDLAVVALDNGDTAVARRLLTQALETHPQHFEAAATKLAGL
jgi:Tfp pilus assembly protein PilF